MLLISDKGWMFAVMGVGLVALGAWTVIWNAVESRGIKPQPHRDRMHLLHAAGHLRIALTHFPVTLLLCFSSLVHLQFVYI